MNIGRNESYPIEWLVWEDVCEECFKSDEEDGRRSLLRERPLEGLRWSLEEEAEFLRWSWSSLQGDVGSSTSMVGLRPGGEAGIFLLWKKIDFNFCLIYFLNKKVISEFLNFQILWKVCRKLKSMWHSITEINLCHELLHENLRQHEKVMNLWESKKARVMESQSLRNKVLNPICISVKYILTAQYIRNSELGSFFI